ncbi:SDR family oxidoreductase [Amnibacterium setariae]|uniref:SDR family NAD(P)-dependent oxidoreductase n=1 Tax=Amnibacterium setariae TaxID=2306585 RepID=A0A3A1TW95_9MICO|nr:SDR family oxidoreductase [Amnibacterium setariae]RIX28492.1 SDR family NAD(P)-dependent oxidoreductase [Amnibacterium setariae]
MPRSIDIAVPDQTGRTALVTGGSDGIGFHIASRLARAGAEVLLPVRSAAKGAAAADRIRSAVPGARIEVRPLDLASLASVEALADALLAEGRPLQMLVGNAGLMTPPTRRATADGFELQLGTNHLGHAALVLRLLPLLQAGRARVVSQISVAANSGAVLWDDLNQERSYHPGRAYSSSKIAFGLFGLELQRRSTAAGWGIRSDLAHPGVTPTNLLAAQPGMGRERDTAALRVIRGLSRRGILLGTAESAALPAVLAATRPGEDGGRFFGPGGPLHLGGAPAEQRLYSRLRSEEDAKRIWAESERLTGVRAPR